MSIDLMPGFGAFTPVVSGAALTWNPADKDSRMVLSVADTRATYDGPADFQASGVRGTIGKSTGKWVFELQQETGAQWRGIANASMGLAIYMDSGGLNVLYAQTNQSVWYTNNGGTTIGTGETTWEGDPLTFAFDFDAELMWVAVNGGNWNNSGTADPATGTEGWSFAAMNAGPYFPWNSINTPGQYCDIRTSGMAKSIPSGFSAWA